jgi:hypothetical protein
MTAQGTGATDFNGLHHTPLLWQQWVMIAEVSTVLAKYVGHLERWSRVHCLSALGTNAARVSNGLAVAQSVCAETLV